MAAWTSSGTTLPGNLTIIPSEQNWVFHAMYHLAFLELFSNEVCSRNRVVITDEDEAEYLSFESVIVMSGIFKVTSNDLHISWNIDGFQEGCIIIT
jgi:hypothetical protein